MKLIRYYPFTATGTFTGIQLAPVVSDETQVLTGNMARAGSSLKLAYGTQPWEQELQSVSFLGGELVVSTLLEADWTDSLKSAWLTDYVLHCGTTELVEREYHYPLLFLAQQLGLYEQLSGVSLAYVNRDPVTEVVSIGLNSYPLPFVYQYATQADAPLRLQEVVLRQHIDTPILVSNACKVRYRDQEHVVWAFGGITYAYGVEDGAHDLTTGGGQHVAQVQLGGKARQTSYLVKARLDPADPTIGLYSGQTGPLYTNEEIVLIDTSTWTLDTPTDWTWVGDFSRLPLAWNITDLSSPDPDFYKLTTKYFQFPTSVIGDKKIGSFG